ncbi:zinc-binding dehydrogenase [Roseateles chitinivorans]|uniref:zinc-binding dehydrogenase n=1 Tax=Roseateles chitinivorans TaxID=2917965 RepID=UPI003D66ECF7
MRGYTLQHRDGHVELLLRDDLPRPSPGSGQLLVRVRAAGLNRGEFLAGHGLHGAGGAPKPVGAEAAGEVVEVGDGVQGWRVGDRAMGRCAGGFADFALISEAEALHVPEALDWTEAGAIPLTFLVVYDMLVIQGRLTAGETLLVAGGSSGVGVAALSAAKAMGARVIATSGSAAKLERLKTLGLDLGLETRSPDFAAAVREATDGRGADLAIDTVGGTVFAECVRALGFQGRLAMVGYVDGVLKAELDLEALHARRLHLFGVSNKLRSPQQRAEPVPGFQADWLPLFADGRLRPVVDRVFRFEDLAQAKASMEQAEHLGKIVLAGSAD